MQNYWNNFNSAENSIEIPKWLVNKKIKIKSGKSNSDRHNSAA